MLVVGGSLVVSVSWFLVYELRYMWYGDGGGEKRVAFPAVVDEIRRVDDRVARKQSHALAAFYPAMGRHRAMAEVLRRFRASFPDAPLIVHGATELSCLLASAAAGECVSVPASGWYGGTLYRDVKHLWVWVNGLLRAAARAPWVVVMEDDVWWIQTLDPRYTFSKDFNMAGPHRRSPWLTATLKKRCPWADGGFGGSGGTIIRSSTLMRAFADVDRADALMRDLIAANPVGGDAGTDEAIWLVSACLANATSELVEHVLVNVHVPWHDGIINEDTALVHGIKILY